MAVFWPSIVPAPAALEAPCLRESVQRGFKPPSLLLVLKRDGGSSRCLLLRWQDKKSRDGAARPTILLKGWVLSWSPLLFPSWGVNMGVSLFHFPPENVTSSCTRGKESWNPLDSLWLQGTRQRQLARTAKHARAATSYPTGTSVSVGHTITTKKS